MTTPAQIKASNKYNKENSIQVNIRFNKKYDCDIVSFLRTKPSMSGYVRELIKKDMVRAEYKKSKINA